MTPEKLELILEAALLAADEPMSIDAITDLFAGDEQRPDRKQICQALDDLTQRWSGRGVELAEVASGFRFQVGKELSPWVSRLWAERPARYTRALLETLALIAYRQPVTRGEIEEIRGVSLSSSIIKTLIERDWIRVLGHREVPGRPAVLGTTKNFLDHFNLKSLDELPSLAEIKDLDGAAGDLFANIADPNVADDSAPDPAELH